MFQPEQLLKTPDFLTMQYTLSSYLLEARRKRNGRLMFTCCCFFAASAFCAAPPSILALDKSQLVWTSGYTNGFAQIERSTNLQAGSWIPFLYDATMYNRTSLYDYPYYTNIFLSSRTTLLPQRSEPSEFYRIAVQTNTADPSLVLHLAFDNDFRSNGMVLDISGHDNHGLAYGRPGYPTNWPSVTTGPDGSQAAEFHYYADGWGDYGHSGDYIGIPTLHDFLNMPTATIAFWCHYYGDPTGCNCNSTPMQAGMGIGAWTIGRFYDIQTTFEVQTDDASTPIVVRFPDAAPSNDTGGWHHYAITFDHGFVVGYFDGTNCDFGVVPNQILTVGGEYLSLAGWTFNETPWMDDSLGSKHPNNAWINGALDDVRIYNRALAPAEILNLFTRVDQMPPTVPSNIVVHVDSSSQIELQWDPSQDNYRVNGYHVFRNGSLIATTYATHYVDAGLSPESAYAYTIQAYDAADNVSSQSGVVTTNTPPTGSEVEVIVDDAQGLPSLQVGGSWTSVHDPNPPNFWGSSFLAGFETRGAAAVTFRPQLPEAGDYRVYIWNPGSSGYSMWVFSSNIPVDIVHNGSTNTVFLNEQINYATWNYLGTFNFAAGTNGFARVRTDGTAGDVVSADAIRFVK
jgi:hypothetical protein